MEIEATRAVAEETPLPSPQRRKLRRRARLRSTHHSTRIEGSRLTLAEAEGRSRAGRSKRERDFAEAPELSRRMAQVLIKG